MPSLQEVDEFVTNRISSALANHLGGVEVIEVEGDVMRLRMTRSCRTCYFRQGCIDNLVVAELHERFGSHIEVSVR